MERFSIDCRKNPNQKQSQPPIVGRKTPQGANDKEVKTRKLFETRENAGA